MSDFELDLFDETEQVSEKEQNFIRDILNFSVDYLKLEGMIEMSVTLTDNPRIQEINREYRGKNQPTDVISFALEELFEDEIEIVSEEEMPRNIGDIIISIERAKEQADEYGHTFDRELGFLAVHGLLHLLGYDHIEPEDEKEMFGLQKEMLDAYGLQR